MANDPEYAEMVLKQGLEDKRRGGERPKPTPSAVTWSPTVAVLATLVDKVSHLIEVQSSKPKAIVPYPRPRTGFDKIGDQLEMASKQATHDYLVNKMIAK